MKNPIPFEEQRRRAVPLTPSNVARSYDELRDVELSTLQGTSMKKRDLLHVPSGEIVQSHWSFEPISVIEGDPFQAVLHFEGSAYKANWLFKDEDRNVRLPMFPTEFVSLLRRVSLVDPGYVSGTWGYRSRGGVYGIELITAD